MDYFGVSNKNALDYIAQNDTKNIKIYNLNTADLNLSIKILDKKKRKKLSIVYNIEEADYIINSYRDWRGKNAPSKFIIPKNFNIFYEIKVDNVPINTIYKKQ